MPRVSRSEIFSDDEVQVFHLVNRCVRRTFLCGHDAATGKDYSHRKQWIRDRLEELAGIYAIEVMGFTVMSNHLHLVVRTRPDLVKDWSDDEVALRWWNLFPGRRNEDRSPAEPTPFELNQIRNDKPGLKEKRRRLSSVSWFMRCVAEPIARRANKEEKVTGHFWEGRFKAQPLLDEMAIAACMAYVDLNPVRAGVASTPEDSDFTSVQERIVDRESATDVSTPDAQDSRTERGSRAGWLSPIPLEVTRKLVREQPTGRRVSNKGCLPMTLDEYPKLLDWTGRQLKHDKRHQVPPNFAPILQRLNCNGDVWLDLVKNCRKRFRQEVGLPGAIQSFQDVRERRWSLGVNSSSG